VKLSDSVAQTVLAATSDTRVLDGVLDQYRALVRRRVKLLALLTLALACSLCADLATGPSRMGITDVLQALFVGSLDRAHAVIVWEVRLPQALLAILVGAALAIGGTEMQTTLNNPLASPFTLGMSSAAIFGAALAIVLNVAIPGVPAQWVVSCNAFLFALGSVLLLQAAAGRRDAGSETLVLLGIALFFTFNALVAIMQFVATEQALQQLVFWTMGSLARASWTQVRLLAVVVAAVLPFSLAAAWPLTALRLGDERARSLALDVGRVRFSSLLRTSILTATAVSFVGTIAFVGLVGPHIGRMLVGEDHRFLIPASALSGALVLSLASVVSKTMLPGVLIPIGLVTALIGVPFFVSLIWHRGAHA
jgi:iron complex transport system permease protein